MINLDERVFVYLVTMPNKAKAVTVLSGVDEYTVYINNTLNCEMRLQAYKHEMEHIANKDYEHFYDVNVLEHFRP